MYGRRTSLLNCEKILLTRLYCYAKLDRREK
jgi:hypothetical protein